MATCPKCKSAIDPGASFCARCGAKIAREGTRGRSTARPAEQAALIPAVLVVVGIAIVVAAVIWWQGSQSARPLAQAPTAIPAATRVVATAESNLPYPDVPRISVQDAAARLGEPDVVFLDTRSAGVYDQSHIPGAILIEPADLEARYQELSPAAEIITYCT